MKAAKARGHRPIALGATSLHSRAQGPAMAMLGWLSKGRGTLGAGPGLRLRVSDRGQRQQETRTFQSCRGAAHTSPEAQGHPLGSGLGSQHAQAMCRMSPQSLLFWSQSFLSQFHFCHPSADSAKQETSQPCSHQVHPHPRSSSSPFHNHVPHSAS